MNKKSKRILKNILIGTLVCSSLLTTHAYNVQIWSPIQTVKKIYLTPTGSTDSTKATITLNGSGGIIKANNIFIHKQGRKNNKYFQVATYNDLEIHEKHVLTLEQDLLNSKASSTLKDAKTYTNDKIDPITNAFDTYTINYPKAFTKYNQYTSWIDNQQAWNTLCQDNGYAFAITAVATTKKFKSCMQYWSQKDKKFYMGMGCRYNNWKIFKSIKCAAKPASITKLDNVKKNIQTQLNNINDYDKTQFKNLNDYKNSQYKRELNNFNAQYANTCNAANIWKWNLSHTKICTKAYKVKINMTDSIFIKYHEKQPHWLDATFIGSKPVTWFDWQTALDASKRYAYTVTARKGLDNNIYYQFITRGWGIHQKYDFFNDNTRSNEKNILGKEFPICGDLYTYKQLTSTPACWIYNPTDIYWTKSKDTEQVDTFWILKINTNASSKNVSTTPYYFFK